ncbi:MAG: 2-oxo acid dehydrogenase subunit E2 [Pirellulales bacterium]|nr:2-oxo acid dehydrogenase subunit E2 [Pirellulales bacterium]
MRFEMKMPDLAATESEIRIGRWLIEPGEKIERGQPLLEVETDKAAMDVESAVSGVLNEILSQEEDVVEVGQVIAVLEVEGSSTSESASGDAGTARSESPPQPAPKTPPPAAAAKSPDTDKPQGMFARNRAAVEAAKSAKPLNDMSLSPAQRTAGKRLQESKQTVPHFYLQTSFNAGAISRCRETATDEKPAWDAFFVIAVAKALNKFNRFCCRLEGERLIAAETNAVGVAVDVENELYVVPISTPIEKTVVGISQEIRDCVQRLRNGDTEVRMIKPALITISNLGVANVESFIPIINPPEAAILGIGKVTLTPVAQEDGGIGIQQRCTLTLSVDHRIASGKYAGEFLAAIIEELESV